MYNGRHQFLRNDKSTHYLSTNALERVICRGLAREELTTSALPILANSEPNTYCSDVDVSTVNLAFGRWALPKLKKELLSSNLLESKRALLALLDTVHDPERAVDAIRLQVIPRLVRLMVNNDTFIRLHVLMVLQVLALQPGGKLAIVNNTSIMRNLTTVLSDTDKSVRLQAAKTLWSLASWYFGVQQLVQQDFIRTTMQRLNTEQDSDIQVILLEALELLLDLDMRARQQGLECGGVELAGLLEHPEAGVRRGAAAVISQLARHAAGVRTVLHHKPEILESLTHLLEDQDTAVRTQAAGTLMFLLIATEAKKRCLELRTAASLLTCAQLFPHPALQLNALKALTNLAEAPAGQHLLRNNLPLIQSIRMADSVNRRHKKILIDVINKTV